MDLGNIVEGFVFEGEFSGAEKYNFGHINETYIIYFTKKGKREKQRYILQKINHNVFKNPEQVMENIEKVIRHLQDKIIENGGDLKRETLNIIPSVDGKCFYRCPRDNFWRAYEYIEGSRSYQIVESPYHFYSAGKTIGKFQKLLHDFPPSALYDTIPGFHDTRKRYEDFLEAVNKDLLDRAQKVRGEIDFVKHREDKVSRLVNMLREGKLPLRVIHNDTKFNNVLIDDQTGEGVCLVDLDTVMPGLSLYDFGDAIRYGTNLAGEDEHDLSKVNMDLMLYEQFCRGYLETTGDILTEDEVKLLPFAAWLITLECGMRFLTDYLNGDVYFKVSREGQNCQRARTQFKLVWDMESKYELMKNIIEKYRK